MTKAELYGGPFDGRELAVPDSTPLLRVPVPVTPLDWVQGDPIPQRNTVKVARYVRVDHAFGNKISYRYQGDEDL